MQLSIHNLVVCPASISSSTGSLLPFASRLLCLCTSCFFFFFPTCASCWVVVLPVWIKCSTQGVFLFRLAVEASIVATTRAHVFTETWTPDWGALATGVCSLWPLGFLLISSPFALILYPPPLPIPLGPVTLQVCALHLHTLGALFSQRGLTQAQWQSDVLVVFQTCK